MKTLSFRGQAGIRKLPAAILAVSGLLVAGFPVMLAQRPGPADPEAIRWPSPQFRRLQEAVDAARDGSILEIAPGVHRVPEPVVIRNKRLTIRGAGCPFEIPDSRTLREMPQRGAGTPAIHPPTLHPSRISTRLLGPRADRVTPYEDARGVLEYDRGGGLLQGVGISGRDAGILIREGQPLTITDSCVVQSSRGLLALTPSALAISDSLFLEIAWNGVSLVGSLSPIASGQISLINMLMKDVANACIPVPQGWSLDLNWGFFQNCQGGGIIADRAQHANINGVTFAANRLMGIALIKTPGSITYTIVNGTQPVKVDGIDVFGDGISGVLSQVLLQNNFIAENARAGVSNFGSQLALKSNLFICNAVQLAFQNLGSSASFEDAGGNVCTCPPNDLPARCIAEGVGLEPPAPTDP